MNRPQTNLSMDRRTLIKGAAAALGLSTISACQGEEVASTSNSDDKTPRLYKVIPANDKFNAAAHQMKPAPMAFSWETRSGFRAQARDTLDYFVWATSDEAASIGKHETVKSIAVVKPSSVVTLGEPSKANGKIAVKLFPNSAWGKVETKFETTAQVVAKWQKQLKEVPGLKISTPEKKKQEDTGYGQRPEIGQIVIEFEGTRLDAKVLKAIKSHPQTLAIKWGELFTYFYCPGCGLG